MRKESNTAQKAQGASNATETPPQAAYSILKDPEDDQVWEKLQDEISARIKSSVDGIKNIYDNYPSELNQKHAIYEVLANFVSEKYPFKMVCYSLITHYRSICPEYIFRACTNVYLNQFLTA